MNVENLSRMLADSLTKDFVRERILKYLREASKIELLICAINGVSEGNMPGTVAMLLTTLLNRERKEEMKV